MLTPRRSLTALLLAAHAASSLAAGDAANGAQLYEQRCGGCHAVDANRVGPLHRNVFGRKAGAAPAYDYSPALRNSTVRWGEVTLNAWLSDPEKFIPGQRMGYAVNDAGDRSDLIAYLRSVSKP
ncbi:MAG TPA: c-type cytochrome [Burkholderiales bacterium]|nr:c-type cytochrome [Burkholderiales bacterium]